MSVSIALAGVAVVVSIAAAWVSLHAQREVIRSETVTATFEGFRRVSELRVSCWQAAHVLETPENYDRTVGLLRTALERTAPAEIAELLVRERAVAIAVVQIFEESVFQYEHATRLRDSGRARFLEDVLSYYTERLLLNPRLLWLWAPEGGNMRADFEPATRSYYDAHVQVPRGAPVDDVGPFPGSTAASSAP